MRSDFTRPNTPAHIISKRDAGGIHFQWIVRDTSVTFTGTVGSSIASVSINGFKTMAVNFSDDELPVFYADGAYWATGDTNVEITTNTAHMLIGNRYDNDLNGNFAMREVMVFNRVLIADEHSAIHAEALARDRRVSTRPYEIVGGTWRRLDGIYESTTLTTSEELENTNFIVDSGTFKVVHEEINGRLTPVIECVVAGTIYADATSLFRQSTSQAAYGTWEWMQLKEDTSELAVTFASTSTSSAGYYLTSKTDESFEAGRSSGGSAELTTAAGYLTADQWHKCTVVRSGGNEFTISMDDVPLVAATGTNPFTESTNTTATHFVAEMDAGDKITLIQKKL
jgi:hypothetical protein